MNIQKLLWCRFIVRKGWTLRNWAPLRYDVGLELANGDQTHQRMVVLGIFIILLCSMVRILQHGPLIFLWIKSPPLRSYGSCFPALMRTYDTINQNSRMLQIQYDMGCTRKISCIISQMTYLILRVRVVSNSMYFNIYRTGIPMPICIYINPPQSYSFLHHNLTDRWLFIVRVERKHSSSSKNIYIWILHAYQSMTLHARKEHCTVSLLYWGFPDNKMCLCLSPNSHPHIYRINFF